jgi:hypothetical protein
MAEADGRTCLNCKYGEYYKHHHPATGWIWGFRKEFDYEGATCHLTPTPTDVHKNWWCSSHSFKRGAK